MKTVYGHMNPDPSGVPLGAPEAPVELGAGVRPKPPFRIGIAGDSEVWQATFAAAISAGHPPWFAAEYAMEGVLCWRAAIKGGA